MDAELQRLLDRLLWRLHVPLTHEDGDEAFERHILLAVHLTRAADLFGAGDAGRSRWVDFLTNYFPDGPYSEDVARALWDDWRNGLVHDVAPRGLAVTHLHPEWHLRRPEGRLCVDLESMGSHFEHAVRRAVGSLEDDASRREVVLTRWMDWEVVTVLYPAGPLGTRRMGPVGLLPAGSISASSPRGIDSSPASG
jgi:hypothetical protein